MTADEARARFAAARVARLATAGADGRPHLVPVVFAVSGDIIYSAVDAKPKRTTALRRLANVRQNPAVALLVDHYVDDDWGALWWVRADGRGRVLDPAGETGSGSGDDLAAEAAEARRWRSCASGTPSRRPPERCWPLTWTGGGDGRPGDLTVG